MSAPVWVFKKKKKEREILGRRLARVRVASRGRDPINCGEPASSVSLSPHLMGAVSLESMPDVILNAIQACGKIGTMDINSIAHGWPDKPGREGSGGGRGG